MRFAVSCRAQSGQIALWSAIWLFCLGGCAGYQVGTRSLYPQSVRYVYVPVFQSDSLRPGLSERLTEAVIKEIELKTSFKVTGRSQADSILMGRITTDSRRTVLQDPNDQPREMINLLRVQVSWVTTGGQALSAPIACPVPDTLAEAGQTATLAPETGQSLATAQQQQINRLAAQIVAMMQVPW